MPSNNSRREFSIGIPSLLRICLSLMSRSQRTRNSLDKQGLSGRWQKKHCMLI